MLDTLDDELEYEAYSQGYDDFYKKRKDNTYIIDDLRDAYENGYMDAMMECEHNDH